MRRNIGCGKVLSNVILALFFIFTLVPFVMVLFTAFKTPMEINDMPYRTLLHRILPDNFLDFSNIINVWNGTATQLNGVPFYHFIKNSLIVLFGSLFPSLVLALTSAYGFAKLELRGKNVMFSLTNVLYGYKV